MTIHWRAVEQDFTWYCLFFNFTQFVMWGKLSNLDLALSGVKTNTVDIKVCTKTCLIDLIYNEDHGQIIDNWIVFEFIMAGPHDFGFTYARLSTIELRFAISSKLDKPGKRALSN